MTTVADISFISQSEYDDVKRELSKLLDAHHMIRQMIPFVTHPDDITSDQREEMAMIVSHFEREYKLDVVEIRTPS